MPKRPRKTKKTTSTDPLRTAILRRLSELKCERWALAACPRLRRTASRSTLWRYLSGKRESTRSNIGEIIRLLGGRIVWNENPDVEDSIRNALSADGEARLTSGSKRR